MSFQKVCQSRMLGLKELVCTLFSDKPGFVVFCLLRAITGYGSSKDSDDWLGKRP